MIQLLKSLDNMTVSHNKWQNYYISFTVSYLCFIFKGSELLSSDHIKLPFWSARSNQQCLFYSHALQHICWRGLSIHSILRFWLCYSTLSINLHRMVLLLRKVWLWYVAISHMFNQLAGRCFIVISLSCCVNLQTSKIVLFLCLCSSYHNHSNVIRFSK